MRFFLSTIPAVLLIVVLIVFSIANRHEVAVYLDPVPYTLDMPLFLLFFAGIFLGVCLTAITLAGRRMQQARRLRRSQRREKDLEKRVGELERGGGTDITERLNAIDRAQGMDSGAKAVLSKPN